MTDNSFQTINPLTEAPIETYRYIGDDEMNGVIEASHAAFLD